MSAADERPAGGSGVGRRVTLLALSLMLLPVGLAVCLFPLLAGSPFHAVESIDPAMVASLRVFVLNRAELDGGPDVGPFVARPDDVAGLLAPLTRLTALPAPPEAARGPWLGEYRIRTTDNRRAAVWRTSRRQRPARRCCTPGPSWCPGSSFCGWWSGAAGTRAANRWP